MTNKELEQMAQKSLAANEITHWSTGTSGFHKGFEACYRLLTTPRPMSEAPRDGSDVIGIMSTGALILMRWFDHQEFWVGDGLEWKDKSFCGWLPIFTPIEEDANG